MSYVVYEGVSCKRRGRRELLQNLREECDHSLGSGHAGLQFYEETDR